VVRRRWRVRSGVARRWRRGCHTPSSRWVSYSLIKVGTDAAGGGYGRNNRYLLYILAAESNYYNFIYLNFTKEQVLNYVYVLTLSHHF